MVAQLFGFIGEVIGVHADAVATHQSRPEPKRIPLGVHAVHDLVGVDVHPVKHHRQLVHKSDVDVALAVLHDLDGLCRPDVRHGIGPHLDDNIVDMLDFFQRLFVHTGNDFPDVFQPMGLITGVDALRAVADLEIGAADHAGAFFQNGDADILGAARVDRGLIYHDGTLFQVLAHDLRRTDHRGQVWRMVKVHRRRHSHHDEVGLPELLFLIRELHGGVPYLLVAHFLRRVCAGAVGFYFFAVGVKANDIQALLCKCHRNRHSHIAKTDHSQHCFFGNQFLIQRHDISPHPARHSRAYSIFCTLPARLRTSDSSAFPRAATFPSGRCSFFSRSMSTPSES